MKKKRIELDYKQVVADHKRNDLTPEQRTRIEVISLAIAGVNYLEIAEKYKIHRMTITEWILYYKHEGLEGLKRPIIPIKKTSLDVSELEKILRGCNDTDRPKINALIDLTVSKNTKETANKWGISPQGLLKWKRKYLAGELPKSLFL